ncbi:MAG: hypothetical protein JWN96_295, partial [Mycobacterium sp.]|nr:hypothetical protein [Mycobacterium sp.]
VQAAGYESAGAGWALLAGVAYLFARSRRVGGPLIAIVWCATLLAALGAYNVVGPVTLDTAFVEQSITNDLNDAATVTCPDREVLRMNDSFYCIATNGSDTVRYLVTLTGHDGTFTWIPVG